MSTLPRSVKDPSSLTIVGLSGGVDSSVAAWMLREQGHRVQGIYMHNWRESGARGCDQAALDAQDAYSVAASLGIAVSTADLSKPYMEQVFQPCLQDFHRGLTPNPDILCNKHIKFRAFLDLACTQGAEYIATGHYARIRRHDGCLELLMGLDKHKDQSYFLYRLNQAQLAHIRFPLGELHKPQVREMAARNGLVTCDKPDSTGICFIGKRKFRAFLARYLPIHRGELVDADGNTLGTHDGIWFYTIGQRHGMGIGGLPRSSGEPWYVAAKDAGTNRLTVVQGAHHPLLYTPQVSGIESHWIAGHPPATPCRCQARLRHGQAVQPCTLVKTEEDRCSIAFDIPQRAVTPGQSIVLYQGEVCLGGAYIAAPTD